MPAIDTYRTSGPPMGGPARQIFPVTPSDTNELPFVTTGVYVGTGGDLAVKDYTNGGTVIFKNVAGGSGLPIRVAQILATGTTATDIVGLA